MNADEAVVYGAAVQAAILSDNDDKQKFNRLELEDVTSLSFGLERRDGATLNLLIPKHTPIPAKKELIFTTCSDNLSSFLIQVQECELASTTVFNISGITPKPRGSSKINLSFEVDESGILNLTAEDRSAKGENEIVISKENGGLRKEEIQKMLEAAAHYKAEDEEHKERAAALNSLENIAYKIKTLARDQGVSASDKKLMKEAADVAIAWLDTNHHAPIDEINDFKAKLETLKSQVTGVGP
jgi:molecular chaperone DnaK (HSP70)